jgi:uncharacterized protein (TIGR03066 family)
LLALIAVLPAPAKDAGRKGTKVPTDVADQVVGTWQARSDKGLTYAFHKDGSLRIIRQAGKARVTVDCTYKVRDGNNLQITVRDPKGTGRHFTSAVQIKSVTDRDLVLVFRGKFKGTDKELTFGRVK